MQTKEHHGGFFWRICLSFVCFLFCLFLFFFFFLRPPKFVIADLEIAGGDSKFLPFTSEKTLFESIACSFVGFLRCYEKFQPFDCLSGNFFTRNRSAFLLFWIWSKSCASNRPYWIGLVLLGTRLQAAPISLGFSNEMQFENFMLHVERKIVIKGTACNQVLNFIHAWCLVRYSLFSRQKVTRFCYFNQVGFHRYIYFCKFFYIIRQTVF